MTVLDAPDGGKVYLVGTAHFSLESQEDVSKVRLLADLINVVLLLKLCVKEYENSFRSILRLQKKYPKN